MIENEDDVREWVRDRYQEKAYWVEHSAGGTEGLQDVFLLHRCNLFPIELKCEEMKGEAVACNLRPSQKAVYRRMAQQHIPSGVLIGVKGSDDVMYVDGGMLVMWEFKIKECIKVRTTSHLSNLIDWSIRKNSDPIGAGLAPT